MILSVRNINLRRQVHPTSCWISAAHFVLQHLGVQVSLATLHERYYNRDPTSILAMSGAGHPKEILTEYAFDEGFRPDTLKPEKVRRSEVVAVIADSIREDIPVIAAIRSPQIRGFGHALVITAVDPETGTIAFKDPGTGTTPRSFGVDVRTVQYKDFFTGFSYRYANRWKRNIWAYCSEITYLRRYTMGSLFD